MRKKQMLVRKTTQRGALLVEAALAVGVAVSLIGLTISITREQQSRSDAVLIGSEKATLIDSAIQFINETRPQILADLYQSASSGGPAMATYDLADLVAGGFVPDGLNLGSVLQSEFGQEYRILARLISQNDPNTPAASLDIGDIDPAATGAVDPQLIDGVLANGELGIEAVLMTIGGDTVPIGQGGRIITASNSLNAAFLYENNIATGPGGVISFDVSGFAGFPGFAGGVIPGGRFASVLSFGSPGDFGAGNETDLRDTFARCEGLNVAGTAYIECLNGNRGSLYGDLNLTPSDENNDGTDDRFPAITGATRILCLQELDGIAAPVAQNAFLIDCETTRLNGVLDVTGDEIRLGNETLAERREIGGVDRTVVSADSFALRLNSGAERDLSTNVISTQRVAAQSVIPVQECPARSADGTQLVPKATAQIQSILDPWGRAIAGSSVEVVRGNRPGGISTPFTANANGSLWQVQIRYAVNNDFCNSTFLSPINIRSTYTNANAPNSAPRFIPGTLNPNIAQCDPAVPANRNQVPDVYQLHPIGNLTGPVNSLLNFGFASVSLSCGAP